MSSPVLQSLIAVRIEELLDEMPGVRDGDVESIHRARVASRRIRELLPLSHDDRATAEAQALVRDAGRQLGRVRDLDIMADLLARYECAVPSAVVTIALARRTLRYRRSEAVRALVKHLEQLDLALLERWRPTRIQRALPLHRASLPLGHWAAVLRDRIDERARAAADAVEHAAGIYFPNRLHRTRIAVKKLRYSVEIAEAVHVPLPTHLVADLRKIQARLGDIHDLQVLAEDVAALAGPEAPAAQLDVLRRTVEADVARLHAWYRDRRDRLLAAIDACRRLALRPVAVRPAVALSAASAVVIPALLLTAGRRGK